jgi:geranylgeranyl pyrophosphate synthase
MNNLSDILPSSSSLDNLFRTEELQKLVSDSLLDPIATFFSNPGKNFRSHVVEIGYCLSLRTDPQEISPRTLEQLRVASYIVELIHGGSLIVDDIQDSSQTRRNAPTLHLSHGLPIALNAGNWLYFWALSQIKSLELGDENEREVINDVLSLMMKAHTGQALDIGTRVDLLKRKNVKETCLASMELKTGTLMTLALRLGSGVAGQNWNDSQLSHLGSQFGVLLQMFDDLGNFLKTSPKQFEDLYLNRPSWVWAVASEMDEKEYCKFTSLIRKLPHSDELNLWMEETQFRKRLIHETDIFKSICEEVWSTEWKQTHPVSLKKLLDLNQRLEKVYV